MAVPSSAVFSVVSGAPAVLAGGSICEAGNGFSASFASMYTSTTACQRHSDRELSARNGIASASSSQNPERPKFPSTRRAASSSDCSFTTRVMASPSIAAVLVNSFDRLSLATNDSATAQAAAAEAVALARSAAKAAREAAEFARLQLAPAGSYATSPGETRHATLSSCRADSMQAVSVNSMRFLSHSMESQGSLRKTDVEEIGVRPDTKRELKGRSSLNAASVMEETFEMNRVEVKTKADNLVHVVSFSGLASLPNQHQVVVRSKKRAERLQRRERASEKVIRVAKNREAVVTAKRPTGPQGTDQYLYNHIGKSKLLTAVEEVELSKCIQDLMKLERLKATLEEQIGREPNPQEWAQAVGITTSELRRRVSKGRESKNTMVMSNLRLVYSIAKKYSGRGVALEDLVSDGCKGLIRGTEKFDHSKGFKFSTYAHWWIRQAITRSITDQARTIRLPGHLYETLSRITKAREMLYEENGRAPTSEEVAELVGISQHKYMTTMRSIRQPVSMETTVGQEGEETLGEILADPSHDEDARTDFITNQLLRADIENVLHTLNPREQDVLRLRYGLDDGYQRTLEEVGNLFRVTRERIRQIETNALRKLRQPSRSKVLREYSVSNS